MFTGRESGLQKACIKSQIGPANLA